MQVLQDIKKHVKVGYGYTFTGSYTDSRLLLPVGMCIAWVIITVNANSLTCLQNVSGLSEASSPMIVYKKEWLDNLAIRKAASKWNKQGMISSETQEGIVKTYPTQYKRSGIFARIGMFIFTLIILDSF